MIQTWLDWGAILLPAFFTAVETTLSIEERFSDSCSLWDGFTYLSWAPSFSLHLWTNLNSLGTDETPVQVYVHCETSRICFTGGKLGWWRTLERVECPVVRRGGSAISSGDIVIYSRRNSCGRGPQPTKWPEKPNGAAQSWSSTRTIDQQSDGAMLSIMYHHHPSPLRFVRVK